MYDSAYISWYKNGTIQEQGTYREDKKNGIWKFYDSTGLLKYESIFAADTEFLVYTVENKNKPLVVDDDGVYKAFYDNRTILEQGIIENFCRKGIWRSFYENGASQMVVFWSDNRKKVIDCWKKYGSPMVKNGNGNYVLTTENDSLLLKGEYRDSLQSGEWNYYFPVTGTVYRRSLLENGFLNVTTKLYYDSGKLYCEGIYKNDMRDGEWIWYHENGAVSSKVSYAKDKKQGKQLHYNNYGTKIREENYENGILVSEKNFI